MLKRSLFKRPKNCLLYTSQAAHAYFHRRLVRSVAKELTSEEKSAMIKGMIKLNDFFKQKLNEMED